MKRVSSNMGDPENTPKRSKTNVKEETPAAGSTDTILLPLVTTEVEVQENIARMQLLENTVIVKEVPSQGPRVSIESLQWPRAVRYEGLTTRLTCDVMDGSIVPVGTLDTLTLKSGFTSDYQQDGNTPGQEVRIDRQVTSPVPLPNNYARDITGLHERLCGGKGINRQRMNGNVKADDELDTIVIGNQYYPNKFGYHKIVKFGVSEATLAITEAAARVDFSERFLGEDLGCVTAAHDALIAFPHASDPLALPANVTEEPWLKEIYRLSYADINVNNSVYNHETLEEALDRLPRKSGGNIEFPIVKTTNRAFGRGPGGPQSRKVLYSSLAFTRPGKLEYAMNPVGSTQEETQNFRYAPFIGDNEPVTITKGTFHTPPGYANYLEPLDIAVSIQCYKTRPRCGARNVGDVVHEWEMSLIETITDVTFDDFALAIAVDYATTQGIALALYADGGFRNRNPILYNSDMGHVKSNILNGLKTIHMEAPISLNTNPRIPCYAVTNALNGIPLLGYHRKIRPVFHRASGTPGFVTISAGYELCNARNWENDPNAVLNVNYVEEQRMGVTQIASKVLNRMMSLPARLGWWLQTHDEFLGCYVRTIMGTAALSTIPEMPRALEMEPLGVGAGGQLAGDRIASTLKKQKETLRKFHRYERTLQGDPLFTRSMDTLYASKNVVMEPFK